MAYEIWEHNTKEEEVTIIGIEGSGAAVARELAKRLEEISKLKVDLVTIRLNKKQPLADPVTLDKDLNGKAIVLVDDVANSGKTLLYGLKATMDYEPKRILLAVLVDRKHKSFPVSADIVGHSVATTIQDHIEVICEKGEIEAAYLI